MRITGGTSQAGRPITLRFSLTQTAGALRAAQAGQWTDENGGGDGHTGRMQSGLRRAICRSPDRSQADPTVVTPTVMPWMVATRPLTESPLHSGEFTTTDLRGASCSKSGR